MSWQAPDQIEFTCSDLLGPLNDVERKFAPPRVFIAGNREILASGFRVSIVGSRNASREGLQRARKLAVLVQHHGGVVVSGLAKGIDTAAHAAAIDAGGPTIAVIGTPLNRAYPNENAKLQQTIMEEHLCISQFPFGYPIRPQNFPIRNRTMALFSDATVIVEAGETSGSISQGWEALRLGRGLFIANWLLESDLKWPGKMMAYGAQVLSDSSVDQFIESLPLRSGRDNAVELDELGF